MQTFIDRYIEQGRQLGSATLLLDMIEHRFGQPGEAVREQVMSADPDTLREWSKRIFDADSVDALLH